MKYLFLLILLSSCHSHKTENSLLTVDSLPMTFTPTGSGEAISVNAFTGGLRKRYFLISYSVREKENPDIINEGYTWWWSYSFPSEKDIAASVFKVFKKSPSCYQHLIVTNIFEFRDSADYYDFSKGLKSDPPIERHTSCGGDGIIFRDRNGDGSFRWYPVLIGDSTKENQPTIHQFIVPDSVQSKSDSISIIR